MLADPRSWHHLKGPNDALLCQRCEMLLRMHVESVRLERSSRRLQRVSLPPLWRVKGNGNLANRPKMASTNWQWGLGKETMAASQTCGL